VLKASAPTFAAPVPPPLDAEPDRHHELMFGVFEDPVFERSVEVLESVGACGRWIHWAGEGISLAERYREIFGDPFGELCGYIALPHWRYVASVEVVDGWK
jgi:hypothetical protein